MLEKKSVYKCDMCGNIVEGLWNGKTDVSCCAQPMTKVVPNSVDAAEEKHVPVLIRDGSKVTVKVGDVPHPMTKEHYILFVELIAGDNVLRHDFKEGDELAEATFCVEEQNLTARAFCNLHGFWTSN